MMTLDQLALKYGTDKSSKGHGFTRWYEALFGAVRWQDTVILEIGIWHGASLRMWREWVGPRPVIAGLDDDPALRAEHEALAQEEFRIFHGHQQDVSVLDRIVQECGPFDLVIDDGGHRPAEQIASFGFLWGHVKPGGWYAIEDLATADDRRLSPDPHNTIAHFLAHLLQGVMTGARRDIEVAHVSRELCVMRKA
jgi:hypothetical protein